MTKYFVTGGSGFIGSEVVDELISHGYQVLALARSNQSADQLTKAGAEVLRGDLEDLEILKKGASETDGVLHLGFIHDMANFEHSCDVDTVVAKTFIEALKGTNKPFVYSTSLVQAPMGSQTKETDRPIMEGTGAFAKRYANDNLVRDSAANDGVRSIVIRIPPTVHGEGDKGFVPELIKAAKEKEVSYYIDEGKNTWPAVHKKDLAALFRLAAEKGVAGSVYHGAHDEALETKVIAETIGKSYNLPTKSLPKENALSVLGFVGFPFGFYNGNPSTEKARALGWKPKEVGLLEDIEQVYKTRY